MRLWHSKLIPLLDGRRLCDLHMSCCNLRGKGWGKRNIAINYIYEDPLGEDALAVYHMKVLSEMEKRGYKYQQSWWDANYCGKNRPSRTPQPYNIEDAFRRDVPLKGHGLEFYLNDVKTLQERGLDISVTNPVYCDDKGYFTIFRARHDDVETTYTIRCTGGDINGS